MSCDSPTARSPAPLLRWRNTRPRRALPRAVILRRSVDFGEQAALVYENLKAAMGERQQPNGKYRPNLAPLSLTSARAFDLSRGARQGCQCCSASASTTFEVPKLAREGAPLEVEAIARIAGVLRAT